MENKNMTSRKIKALVTKKALFESAIALFSEKGYDRVSVDMIVAMAGTSKGAFYTHFKSKDQVIIEQFKQIDEHYLKVYKDLAKLKTAVDKLKFFIKQQQTFTSEELGLDIIKVVYYSQLTHGEEKKYLIDGGRALYKIVKEIIMEGQKNGEFRNDVEASELTKMIVRCMRGTFYDWCLHDGDFDLVESAERFFPIFIEGIKKP